MTDMDMTTLQEAPAINPVAVAEHDVERIQLIVFRLGSEEYALPIDQVKEIVPTPRISQVPQTPEYVLGIGNIRGHVIPIVDLAKKFGLREIELDAALKSARQMNYTLVIHNEETNTSIGVQTKQVPSTLTVVSSKIEDASSVMQHSSIDESAIRGVANINSRLIILVDIHRMIEVGDLKVRN